MVGKNGEDVRAKRACPQFYVQSLIFLLFLFSFYNNYSYIFL